MDALRQLAVFLLAWSLLSGCLCTPPTRSHRQKRGLMKMMMHIMWDPVRLIRYWHVYDVSKEIAKSWRKILPTIMLLPVTNNNPHSYPGIAKYVHPTIGFKDSKKYILKHAKMPHYHKAAGSVHSVAVPPKLVHPALLPHYALASDMMQHYYSSKGASDHAVQNDVNSMQPVIVGQVPYGEGEDQHTVAHYYMRDSSLMSHKFSPFEGNSIQHDNIRPASSQHVPRTKERVPGFVHPSANHIHYVPHTESEEHIVHDDSEKRNPLVLHPGQEFRVVLHPIPVREFDPNVLKPPHRGHEVQYVPVHPKSQDSYDSVSPILLKAVHAAEPEDVQYVHNHHHYDEGMDSDEDGIDRSESSAESTSSSTKSKHGVTWVLKKNPGRKNPGKRKNPGEGDLRLDSSVKSVLSIKKSSRLKEESKKNASLESDSKVRKTFGLSKFNINMEQLREDLKHGTPVLIPFNKNSAYTSEEPTGGQSEVQQSWTTQASIAANVPPPKDYAEKEQGHSGEQQDNHRLLLFLKKNSS